MGDEDEKTERRPSPRKRVVDPNERLVRDIERIIKNRLTPIEVGLRNLEETVNIQGRQVGSLMQNAGMRDIDPREADKGSGMQPDTTWGCIKCRTRLGHYDPNREIIRTAKGQHVVYVHVGLGGWVKTVCPVCREENWVNYQRDEDTPEYPAVDNEIVLNVPELQKLLAEALTSEHGHTVIRITDVSPDPAYEVDEGGE